MDFLINGFEGTTPQDEPQPSNSFMDMLFDAMGGVNSPMLRKTEQWGDICRDQPEISLTDEEKQALRCWAYTMVVYSGIVDRMADVIERAVHLGFCRAKQEYY